MSCAATSQSVVTDILKEKKCIQEIVECNLFVESTLSQVTSLFFTNGRTLTCHADCCEIKRRTLTKLTIEMNVTPLQVVKGETEVEETDTVFLVKHMSTMFGLTYTIQHVKSCEESCVAPYRMKQVRNHTIASQQKREMLDQNQNWILALSLNVVHRALNGQQEVLSLLVPYESEVHEALRHVLQNKKLKCTIYVTRKCTMDSIIGYTLNKCLAAAAIVNVKKIPFDLLTISRLSGPFIILDDVRSAENIGSILRVAFSLGIKTLICSHASFQGLNTRSARVSMGTLFHFSIFYSNNILATIQQLIENNIYVISTSPTASQTIFTLISNSSLYTDSWALILGNEDKGSSCDVLNKSSLCVALPQCEGDSFSVVTAAAMFLYELRKPYFLRKIGSQNQYHFVPDLP